MRYAKTRLGWLGGCAALVVLAGCVTTKLEDAIPADVQDRFERVSDGGAALRLVLNPDGEQVNIDTGAADISLNRLFSGMVGELAESKFGGVDEAAGDTLNIDVTYLGVESRTYRGAPYIHRLDMTVRTEFRDGERRVARESTRYAASDVQGYSVATEQIYDLLLQHILAIDALIDTEFAAGGWSGEE